MASIRLSAYFGCERGLQTDIKSIRNPAEPTNRPVMAFVADKGVLHLDSCAKSAAVFASVARSHAGHQAAF